ncbi:MAG: threonylcarbamoyl-AMP synthase [Paenibacillaceae bacterium ZCTH02-B3]|nr:MAG: threonylcarbamoyl-AMP synthase [Paenibacillaceae bacterium ZCTH02-B3]
METRLVAVDPEHPDEQAIAAAAEIIRRGGLVAFPTETVYGLGANALDPAAVRGIFRAKGRPSDNPLIVHLADPADLPVVAVPLPLVEPLARRFWPGPLTLVLPRTAAVPDETTAGLDTVAVRVPDHPVALALIRASGCPIAAPSANRSGRPSPTTAAHVLADLAGRIAGVLDGGPAGIGVESTVIRVDETGRCIHLLRPGGVTADQLHRAAPHMDIHDASESAAEAAVARSPGMKYTHYAPRGALTVVRCGDPAANPAEARQRILRAIRRELEALRERGTKTGVLLFGGGEPAGGPVQADLVLDLGPADRPEEAARRLYAALRRFDDAGTEVIFAEAMPETGIGRAVMNRLYKAAGGRVRDV